MTSANLSDARAGAMHNAAAARWLARATVTLGILAVASPAFPSAFGAAPERPLRFETAVLPILRAHCLKCHGLEARKAGLDLRSPALMRRGGDNGPSLVAGSSDESPIFQQVSLGTMPPEGEKKLTQGQIETIRQWIDDGAPALRPDEPLTDAEAPAVTEADRQFWAFRKPTLPKVPKVGAAHRVRSAIDAFLLSRRDQVVPTKYSVPVARQGVTSSVLVP